MVLGDTEIQAKTRNNYNKLYFPGKILNKYTHHGLSGPIILEETFILNTDENKILPALIISQSNHI